VRKPRVFTASWGQLESGGSNIGDLAIFHAQVSELSGTCELGAASADPAATQSGYGVRGFDVREGRLAAFLRGVAWADAVIVGGGELAQDRSSLLYTPFNLMPLRFAWWLRKPSFAWGIGIGQAGELAAWTPGQLGRWLGRARHCTARDEPSARTLLDAGLNPLRVTRTADAAFSLCGKWSPGPVGSDILGAAPRNVANRRGHLLPLEVRRRMGVRDSSNSGDESRDWAELLDHHLERFGGSVRLFPFHTGPLSNSDDDICKRTTSLMRHRDRVETVDTSSLDRFMKALSGCRVMLTVPLHGAILSTVCGPVPVAVPYSTKNTRFMEQAGLERLTAPAGPGFVDRASRVIREAWEDAPGIWRDLAPVRDDLVSKCRLNSRLFTGTCLEGFRLASAQPPGI
jgi:polysaccharide pyruvyl transferase WcaK-like protein